MNDNEETTIQPWVWYAVAGAGALVVLSIIVTTKTAPTKALPAFSMAPGKITKTVELVRITAVGA